MHISWLGGATIKIQTKPFDSDVVVVIDPYKPPAGAFPRSLTPHIALFTNGENDTITLSGNPFTLSAPGECETHGVLITATQGHADGQTLLRIDTEYMSVAHLGRSNKQLTNAQLEVLSGVDILILSVGGEDYGYDAEGGVRAVNSIEPRVVIPMGYRSDTDPKALPVTEFLKAMGSSNGEPEKKVILKKKDLPQEETRVIVLAKE